MPAAALIEPPFKLTVPAGEVKTACCGAALLHASQLAPSNHWALDASQTPEPPAPAAGPLGSHVSAAPAGAPASSMVAASTAARTGAPPPLRRRKLNARRTSDR